MCKIKHKSIYLLAVFRILLFVSFVRRHLSYFQRVDHQTYTCILRMQYAYDQSNDIRKQAQSTNRISAKASILNVYKFNSGLENKMLNYEFIYQIFK